MKQAAPSRRPAKDDAGLLLTVDQLAERFQLKRSWIYEHVHRGLPHFKFGHVLRFSPDEVLKYARRIDGQR